MPIHRAYYATSTEAREAASAAVDALNAKWKAASLDAGALTESTTPVIGVRFDDSTEFPPLAECDAALVDTRITAPDGRAEVAKLAMVTTEADALLTPAYGTARLTSTLSCQVTLTARRAKSVIVEMLDATATVLDNLIVQDLLTGKKYTCGVYTASARGAHTVPVSETSAGDTSAVTFGSVMEFLAPPANAMAIARVNAMCGFTATSILFYDELNRAYRSSSTPLVIADATGMTGSLTGTANVERTPNDDPADSTKTNLTSLEIGETLTGAVVPTFWVQTATVTRKGELTVPADTELTFTSGGTTYGYKVASDTVITDRLYTDAVFTADVIGSSSNRAPGDTLTVTSPPTNVGATALIYTAVAASDLPQRYASQLVGAPVTWTSRVDRASDGRWRAVVYTLPEGS